MELRFHIYVFDFSNHFYNEGFLYIEKNPMVRGNLA